MRPHVLGFCIAVLPSVAAAQLACDDTGFHRTYHSAGPSECRSPGYCRPYPVCDERAIERAPARPERQPERVIERAPESGMYAQPPAVGERIGESDSVGVRGLSIRFPEVTIELPELRLPSLFCARRGPEMRTESARAPYVRGQAATYGMMAPGGVTEAQQVELYRLDEREVELVERERAIVEEEPQLCELRQERDRLLEECDRLRNERVEQPPVPPIYPARSPSDQQPCVPENVLGQPWELEEPCHGLSPVVPPATYPQPFNSPSTPNHFVPPPAPAPTTELNRLRQQLELQQKMLAEMQRSLQQTHEVLESYNADSSRVVRVAAERSFQNQAPSNPFGNPASAGNSAASDIRWPDATPVGRVTLKGAFTGE